MSFPDSRMFVVYPNTKSWSRPLNNLKFQKIHWQEWRGQRIILLSFTITFPSAKLCKKRLKAHFAAAHAQIEQYDE